MSNSRGQVKSRAYTLKEDYKAMALKESQRCERLKKELIISKNRADNLEGDLQDSNRWINIYQQRLIDKIEQGNSIKKRIIGLVFTVGVIAGFITAKLIG